MSTIKKKLVGHTAVPGHCGSRLVSWQSFSP